MTKIMTYVAVALYLVATLAVLFSVYRSLGNSTAILTLIGMGCFLELRCLLLQFVQQSTESTP